MSFYHWFSSHPNEANLSGGVSKLHEIGQELRISDARQETRPKQADFRRISSVPDIWSQHRLFEMLLLNTAVDPSYLEYEAIAKREWRAMLAILVLAESYGVGIHTQTVRFSDSVHNAYLRSAYNTRPYQKAWKSMEIYYVEAGDVRYPIAMSSPTVHVIPTKDAWRNLRLVYSGRIPWLTDNQVFAPVVDDDGRVSPFMLGEKEADKTPAMMPVHALMLQRWLARYRTETSTAPKSVDQPPLEQNIRLITDYEQALAEAFRLNIRRMPKVSGFFASADGQEGPKLNDVRVPKNLKIFLDRVFYSVIDQESTQTEILDTHRFAGGIAPECLVSNQQFNGKTAHFFVAMPVTETFWRLWQDNADLEPAYSLNCEFSRDGISLNKITVSITLGDIRFSRTYSLAQIDTEFWRNLCTAGIWPRQNIASWSDYFLYCNEIGGYRLEPRDRETITCETPYDKRDGTDGPMTYYRLKRAPECCAMLKANGLIGYLQIRQRAEIEKGDKSNILRTAIDFGTSATTLYAGVNGAPAKKISGMHLWSLPLMNTADKEGHDTSRLEKYFFPPLPEMKKRINPATKRAEQAQVSFDALLENPDLAAEYPSCIPMQTILADARDNNAMRAILSDSWIYFRSFVAQRDTERWPSLYSNLKWTHADIIDQHRIRAILTEILTMLALEARCRKCGRIAITATYPLSFEDNTRNSYYETLNMLLGSLGISTGITIQRPAQTEATLAGIAQTDETLVAGITESEAVFRFSVNEDSFNQNYFVVDIGGGSTDIFISLVDENNKRNSMASSLEFGARKILLDMLSARNYFYLRELMKASAAGLDTIIRDQNKYIREFSAQNRDSLIEDLFSIRVPRDTTNPAAALLPADFGEAFLKSCAENIENSTPEQQKNKTIPNFLPIKKRIAFYLGASIWLSGLMLKDVQNTNLSVSLLFAGNGSKMIRWLSPDLQRTRYFIHLLFEEASQISLPQAQFNCRFSTMPKEEVAFGALLGVSDDYFALGSTTASQVNFGHAPRKDGAFQAYRPFQYTQMDVETDYGTVASYMRAFRNIAEQSYGWSFAPGEYDAAILGLAGVSGLIDSRQNNQGCFLNAIDVISAKYLQDFEIMSAGQGKEPPFETKS